MRWGIEVWDRFDEVSNYVHKGIDFCDKYEEFLKKRCVIENSYAKSLRKLIETYEPKKKDVDENESTIFRCFLRMLDEMRDMAGQHELVAENVQEKVLAKINQVTRNLKEERRKCIEDKERFHAEHLNAEELLEKCKQKCEKSFREVEKAEEQLNKVENDDSASKNDIKKQKAVCDQKKRQYDVLEAEYGKQLCEANRLKNNYYYQKLPAVFDELQFLEKKRIDTFKEFVVDYVKIESEVLPRIKQCLTEIDSVARSVNSDQDIELVVRKYKTGYAIPPDHVFEDLKQNSSNSQNSGGNGSLSNGLSGTAATLSVNSMGGSSTSSSRNKKYRTLNRIKGLFTVPGLKSEQESLYDLPPQQLKNELLKKISFIQHEMEKVQKEREGLMKMKEVYAKNQRFGDHQSAEQALRHNEERLQKCVSELKKYQDLYNQVEQQYSCSSNNSNNSEYSSSSSTSGVGGGGGGSGLGGGVGGNSASGQYQSPSQSSTLGGNGGVYKPAPYPGTPISTNSHHLLNGLDSNAVAYAVSPVSHLNTNTNGNNPTSVINSNSASNPKMAPLVNSNESFEDEEDDEDEDEDEEGYEEGGGYESPIGAISTLPNLDSSKNNKETPAAIGFVYASGGSGANGSSVTTNHIEPQYDQVDACLYDQPNANGTHDDTTTASSVEEVQIGTALVMYSFDGNVQNSISIQENESLNVLEKDSGDGWTLVRRLNGEKGYVPTDYIRIVYY